MAPWKMSDELRHKTLNTPVLLIGLDAAEVTLIEKWMADGTYFAPVYESQEGPLSPGPLRRPRMTFVRVSADLSGLDTLGEFGGMLQQTVDVRGLDYGPLVYSGWVAGLASRVDSYGPALDRAAPR